ncbi:outer membrane protein assembly factor BamE, partial [Arenibaculum sp.]|uniref:outer membrane protein assembly factor BamE n=1 Tax=Arenibaculum sp. TaxID=2865862 RepID=UPI002E1637DD|nr:outer membrane protein assembly factor BamE [Arenibaculum sp.]
MAKETRKLLLAAGAMLALAACSPTVNTRGNLLEADRLAQVQPGTSTQDDVAALLGSPSSVGTFDPNVWYYIGQRTEKTAFFRPDVAERKVVVL